MEMMNLRMPVVPVDNQFVNSKLSIVWKTRTPILLPSNIRRWLECSQKSALRLLHAVRLFLPFAEVDMR